MVRNANLVTRFTVLAVLLAAGSMSLLGTWLNDRIEAGLIRSRAEAGALYVEGFLAPHLQAIAEDGVLPEDKLRALDRILIDSGLATRLREIRIWRRDNTVLYSTIKANEKISVGSTEIKRAFSGEIVAQIETAPDDEDVNHGLPEYPLLEVYAPIFNGTCCDVAFVGEFYENADQFMIELSESRSSTWRVVGFTTVASMLVLYLLIRNASSLIERQRLQLQAQVQTAEGATEHNIKLRRLAERTRLEAIETNELLLTRVGLDLHDGPVQLLSLLRLNISPTGSSPEGGTGGAETTVLGSEMAADERLLDLALTELRNISTGLVLPEIEVLTLEETLRLIVDRHRQVTRTKVSERYETLPGETASAKKVCLYRVVQEALSNARRHANAADQSVAAKVVDGMIVVTVSDRGPGGIAALETGGDEKPERVSIGLAGIRNRLNTVGGSLVIHDRPDGGTELVMCVPLANDL